MDNLPEKIGIEVEKNYVQDTYDSIATEFSGTRYKKWPKVKAFLEGLPRGSLLLDVGCGNGKYLDNSSTINLGCDISHGLLSICRSRGFEVLNCDMMKLPFKESTFDAVICIAALHHIVTMQRRQNCLEQMLNLLGDNHHSRLLVQVWSYEQELDKDNPYLKRNIPEEVVESQSGKGEAEREEVDINNLIKIPVHKNRTPFTNQDLLVPFCVKRKVCDGCESGSSSKPKNKSNESMKQHLRYYHVFKENELDEMIQQIPNAELVETYYDKGNWCSVLKKKNRS